MLLQDKLKKMKNTWLFKNSDLIGAWASFLCMVHCLVLPIIISLSVFSLGINHEHWHALDYIFVGISLIAVLYASRRSNLTWIKAGLWITFGIFSFALLGHDLFPGLLWLSLGASLVLMALHLFNHKACSRPAYKY